MNKDVAATPTPVAVAGTRLVSLDVFRGATIAAMILVNNPGTWAVMYAPLGHAEWHGWTPTDLIFPFFLFIVGVAITLALGKRLDRGDAAGALIAKVGYRSVIIFVLGLLMAGFPYFTLAPAGLADQLVNLRIPGVLQRIAVCYFFASLIFLYLKPKHLFYILWGLLLLYWGLMMLVPVPGYGAGQIDDPEGNLAAYIDRLLLSGHLWVGTGGMWDPEGILSTFPAISTTLVGVWAGMILATDREPVYRTAQLFLWGSVLVILGYVWDWFFPINKPIWTSSYAVFTGGQAMCALAICYWVVDVRKLQRFVQPFVVYGMNALTVFFLSGIFGRAINLIRVSGPEGVDMPLQRYIFENVFLPLASPINASLMYALVWVAVWYGILLVMYKNKIFIKV